MQFNDNCLYPTKEPCYIWLFYNILGDRSSKDPWIIVPDIPLANEMHTFVLSQSKIIRIMFIHTTILNHPITPSQGSELS